MSRSRSMFCLAVLFATMAEGQVTPINIEHDVTVASMTSDRFTWYDSLNHPRVAVLAHDNVGVLNAGFGQVYGSALREFRYQLSDGTTRIANVTTYGNGGYGGFGYVVEHSNAGSCVGDDSPLGDYTQTSGFTRVFEGRHHVIFRFTQNYPRNCPTVARTIPVTIDWIFSTGRDNPIYAINYDVDLTSAVVGGAIAPVNTLFDDSRAPYGELNIDGDGSTNISGTAWGDRRKFTSTSAPESLSSSWTYNVLNSVPYVKEWIVGAIPNAGDLGDATMGVVQTQTMDEQDAGGARDPNYHDITAIWDTTSATGNGYPVDCAYTMPCQNEWAYQANADSIGVGVSNNNARLTWRTQWGFVGQSTYVANDKSGATPPGYPKKSYSVYVVLGQHSSSPVEAQLGQVETAQTLTVTSTIGAVASSGPAGITRADNVTYQPVGYNHIYGALSFFANANRIDANIGVGSGTLKNPLIIVGSYSGTYPQVVRLAGVPLTADVDYFASINGVTSELWITLNRNLTGATNRLEIMATTSAPGAPVITQAVPGNGQATFYFNPPSTDGGSAINPYNVICFPGGFNASAAASPIVVGNLSNGVQYSCSATATNGVGTGPSSNTVMVTPSGVVARGDLNGDGLADVVWHNGSTGNNAVWFMNGPTVAASAALPTVIDTNWQVAGIGDFNGDGDADILWHNAVTGDNSIWFMSGPNVAVAGSLPAVPDTNWKIAGVGDFQGDGKADILWHNTATGNNSVWLMNGPNVAVAAPLPTVTDTNWNVAGIGDFQGDGKSDILWHNAVTGDSSVWLMNGINVAVQAALPTVINTAWQIAGVGDLNGDGFADVVWRNASTGDNSVWFMSGINVVVTGALPPVTDTNWKIARVADFQGDGKADILWHHGLTGSNSQWLMNGINIAVSSALPTIPNTSWKVAGPP